MTTEELRRRQVPDRIVADKVVVARPERDEAVVLGGPAAVVWVELDHWITSEALTATLIEHHGEVVAVEGAVSAALRALDDEGLLERRQR